MLGCAALAISLWLSTPTTTPGFAHSGSHKPAGAAAARDTTPRGLLDLMVAMLATAKYHDVNRALADGYIPAGGCVESESGVMGNHYVNLDRMGDGVVDPRRPELLLYVPGPAKPRLVGLEYFIPDSGQPAPRLFGKRFDGPMPGHEPGQPVHYDLHVWTWAHNPSGLFAQYNPRLHC
jgi:hypothetical protein